MGVCITVLGVYLLSQRRESVKINHTDSSHGLLEVTTICPNASPSDTNDIKEEDLETLGFGNISELTEKEALRSRVRVSATSL